MVVSTCIVSLALLALRPKLVLLLTDVLSELSLCFSFCFCFSVLKRHGVFYTSMILEVTWYEQLCNNFIKGSLQWRIYIWVKMSFSHGTPTISLILDLLKIIKNGHVRTVEISLLLDLMMIHWSNMKQQCICPTRIEVDLLNSMGPFKVPYLDLDVRGAFNRFPDFFCTGI